MLTICKTDGGYDLLLCICKTFVHILTQFKEVLTLPMIPYHLLVSSSSFCFFLTQGRDSMGRPRLLKTTAVADRLNFVRLRMAGLSLRAISHQTGASTRTVSRWLQRWYREASLQRRSKRMFLAEQKEWNQSTIPFQRIHSSTASIEGSQIKSRVKTYTLGGYYPRTIDGECPGQCCLPEPPAGLSGSMMKTEGCHLPGSGSHHQPYYYSERLTLISFIHNLHLILKHSV